MTSYAGKFKMATRQNLARMKSCCLSIGWCFLIVLQYGQNEIDTTEGGEGWQEVGPEVKTGVEDPSREGMEAPFSHALPIPSQEALTHERGGEEDGGGREVGRGGKEAGGCGQVTIIITNLTVGPDGCRGWAIYIGSGGSSDWPTPPRNSSRLVR